MLLEKLDIRVVETPY